MQQVNLFLAALCFVNRVFRDSQQELISYDSRMSMFAQLFEMLSDNDQCLPFHRYKMTSHWVVLFLFNAELVKFFATLSANLNFLFMVSDPLHQTFPFSLLLPSETIPSCSFP